MSTGGLAQLEWSPCSPYLLNWPRVGRRDGVDGWHGVVVGVDDCVGALLGQLRLEVAELRLQPHNLVALSENR